MLRLLPLVLLLAASQVQAQTLTLTYARATSGRSAATVTLDRAPGTVGWIDILSVDGILVHITDFETDGEGLRARALLPPAGEVAILFIGEARGGATAWKIEMGEDGYTWVEEGPQIFDQTGRRVASEDELVAIRRRVNASLRGENLKAPREVQASRQILMVTF